MMSTVFFSMPVLAGVLAVLQAAFHIDRAALLDVFASDLGQAVIEGDAVPLRVFNFAGGLVLAAAADVATLTLATAWPDGR
jgi:hypothetical protein